MHKLAIVTFLFARPGKWRQLRYEEYTPKHVNALWRACADNIRVPHRFVAYTDSPEGIECERRPSFDDISITRPDGLTENGCYQRLRMYDPEVAATLGAEHVLILDLDTVMMNDCTGLINACMEHDFTALRGSPWPNGHLCAWYNGSFQMHRVGSRPQFWHGFDPAKFWRQREDYLMPGGRRPHGSDQAWISVCAGNTERTIWAADGAYQYRNWRRNLPRDAQFVFFAGRDKPWQTRVQHENPAVARRWRKYA